MRTERSLSNRFGTVVLSSLRIFGDLAAAPFGSRLREVLLIGLERRTEQAITALASLRGLPTTPLATVRAAVAAEGAPLAVTALDLPDGTGIELAERRDGPTLLLCPIPLAFPPGGAARRGIDAAIVLRGAWIGKVDGWLERRHGTIASDPEAQLLRDLIVRGDVDALVAAIATGKLTARESIAVAYLAAAFSADVVAPVLERIVREDSRGVRPDEPTSSLHGVALDLAIELGPVGLGVVEAVATSDAFEPSLRGRAMRHLASNFDEAVALGILTEVLADSSAYVRLEAAAAALASATRHGAFETVVALARGESIHPSVRVDAIRHLADEWPTKDVAPVLASLVASTEIDVQRAASAAMIRIDGLDVSTLERAMRDAKTFEALRSAMIAVADALPRRAARSVLEPWQSHEDPRARRLAYETTLTVAPDGFEATVDRAIAEGPVAQHAALLGATRLQDRALGALSRLAEAEACDVAVRIAAVRLIAVRFGAAAAPILDRMVRSDDGALAHAAMLAALHLDGTRDAILRAAARHGLSSDVRVEALRSLERRGSNVYLDDAIAAAMRDDDEWVRASAVTLAMRRAGAECAALLDRVASEGLGDAALEGAMTLDVGGYGGAGAIAYDARFAAPVRHRAIRWIAERFAEDERAQLFSAIEAARPGEIARALAGEDEAVALDAPVAPSFWSDVTQRDAPAEALPWDRAPTKPVPPAGHGGDKEGGGAPNGADREGASSAEAPSSSMRDDASRSAVESTPPAAPAEVPTLLRPAPARPPRRAGIDLPRARDALRVALRAGPNGHRGLTALASSDRVPEEVRVQALRHLAADFLDREDIAPLLDRAMRSSNAALQAAALGAAMVREDTSVDSIVHVAEQGIDADTRARATRFLGSKWPVRDVRSQLDRRLEDDDPMVRRAALFALFSTTRFVGPERLEEVLINLFEEHGEAEVRISAAKALGVFGGAAARARLMKESDRSVRDEARAAAERIAERR